MGHFIEHTATLRFVKNIEFLLIKKILMGISVTQDKWESIEVGKIFLFMKKEKTV